MTDRTNIARLIQKNSLTRFDAFSTTVSSFPACLMPAGAGHARWVMAGMIAAAGLRRAGLRGDDRRPQFSPAPRWRA
jgi:hypothetical protein